VDEPLSHAGDVSEQCAFCQEDEHKSFQLNSHYYHWCLSHGSLILRKHCVCLVMPPNKSMTATRQNFCKHICVNMYKMYILCRSQWISVSEYKKCTFCADPSEYLCPNVKNVHSVPIPVTVRSKASVYSRSLAGISDSNPAGVIGVCFTWLLSVVR
jgi:hypothetical protein